MHITSQQLPVLALACMILSGCSSFSSKTWTDLYDGAPLTFTAPRDSSDAIWKRARSWFGGPLRPSLATLSDTLMQSAETGAYSGLYTITITRSMAGEKAKFVVSYAVVQRDLENKVVSRAKDRAYELAYMAATADTPQAQLQRKSRKIADPIHDWHHP